MCHSARSTPNRGPHEEEATQALSVEKALRVGAAAGGDAAPCPELTLRAIALPLPHGGPRHLSDVYRLVLLAVGRGNDDAIAVALRGHDVLGRERHILHLVNGTLFAQLALDH